MAQPDVLASFQFALDIGDKLAGFFQEASGIGSENEIIETKLTDANGVDFIKKEPGRLKWNDVTLKRGITDSMDIWKWRKMVEEGHIDKARTNCTITMLNRGGAPVATWHFRNAWPTKVSGPELKTDSNDYGVEEVVLATEYMYREK
jgi:phage tail-like protein